jgi:hypothetical protein
MVSRSVALSSTPRLPGQVRAKAFKCLVIYCGLLNHAQLAARLLSVFIEPFSHSSGAVNDCRACTLGNTAFTVNQQGLGLDWGVIELAFSGTNFLFKLKITK